MDNKYICYIYNLVSENEKIFLFGFIIKCNEFILNDESNFLDIDLKEYYPNEKYKIELSYSVLNENEFIDFYNKSINEEFFSYNLLKQNGNNIDIKYISEISLNKTDNNYSIISLHKFKNLWIQEYNFWNLDISGIIKVMQEYASPFFDKNSIPLGYFYIMKDNIIFYEQPAKINFSIEDTNINIKFDNNFINYKAKLILESATGEIIFNSIIDIDDIEKNIVVSVPPSAHTLEIFDKCGNIIYIETIHRLMEIGFNLNIIEKQISIHDLLSKKNKNLSSLPLHNTDIPLKINAFDRSNNLKLKNLYKHYRNIFDKNINITNDIKNGNSSNEKSYWFENIGSKECIDKIAELVKESDETIFIDPFFEINKDEQNDINMKNIQNLFLLLNRLSGNITIISKLKNKDYLISQIKNISNLFSLNNLNIKLRIIKDKDLKLHDRYLLIKKQNILKLYSMTNSLNSAIKDYPLGIFYIDINGNNELKEYIYNIVFNKSNEVFNSKDFIEDSEKNINNYIKNLVGDIDITSDNIKKILDENCNNILYKYKELKKEKKAIAYLSLSGILAYVSPNTDIYKSIEKMIINDISSIPDKTSLLLEIEKYLINSYYKKSGLSFYMRNELLDIIKDNKFSIKSYIDINKICSFGYRNNTSPIYGWTLLLEEIYRISPDTLVDFIIKSNGKETDLHSEVIEIMINNRYVLNRHNSRINSPFLNMILLYEKINSNINRTKTPDMYKIETDIDDLIKMNIPKYIIFLGFIYSKVFYNFQTNLFDKNTDKFFNLDIFKYIFYNDNIDDIIQILHIQLEYEFKILNKIINSNLIRETNPKNKLVKEFLIRYFSKNGFFWYSFAGEYTIISEIINIINSLNDSGKKDILKSLLNKCCITEDNKKLNIPDFTNIAYKYCNKNNLEKKVDTMFNIYSRCSEKSYRSIDELIIRFLNLKSNFISHSGITLFLMLDSIFACHFNNIDNTLNNNNFQKFLDELKNDTNLKIFYELYNDHDNFNSESLKNLFYYINTICELNSYQKIYINLINISINIIYAILQYKINDIDKLNSKFEHLNDIINLELKINSIELQRNARNEWQ